MIEENNVILLIKLLVKTNKTTKIKKGTIYKEQRTKKGQRKYFTKKKKKIKE